jgi:hypothetical protein
MDRRIWRFRHRVWVIVLALLVAVTAGFDGLTLTPAGEEPAPATSAGGGVPQVQGQVAQIFCMDPWGMGIDPPYEPGFLFVDFSNGKLVAGNGYVPTVGLSASVIGHPPEGARSSLALHILFRSRRRLPPWWRISGWSPSDRFVARPYGGRS